MTILAIAKEENDTPLCMKVDPSIKKLLYIATALKTLTAFVKQKNNYSRSTTSYN